MTIREDPRKGVYCDATEILITDYESILRALRKGNLIVVYCDHTVHTQIYIYSKYTSVSLFVSFIFVFSDMNYHLCTYVRICIGIMKRAVEATNMNDTSSRSHTIFKYVLQGQ